MSLILKESVTFRSHTINPWTGFYFLQSMVINSALGYEFSVLYAVVFTCALLVLWRHAPRAQKIFIGITSLVAACYFPFGQAYGAPNFNTLLALHSTNMEESTEILTIFPWYHYAIGVFIFALGIVSLRRRVTTPSTPWLKWDTMGVIFCVGSYFIGPVQNHFHGFEFRLYDTGVPVLRFVRDVAVNNYEVVKEQENMAQLSRMKDTWNVLAVKPKYHTYVVVIGESVRRDAMGAFGGHWNNTPFASQVNGNLFMDYISASGSTQKSLGLTLNRVVNGEPQYQDNFVTLANRAGFQTWWFSNQGQIGEYDTAIASIAKRADEVQFLKNGDFEANKNARDEDLLKMTAQVFSTARKQPQLIVLHLMGSHPQACDRTGGKYNEFVQSKETSCYLYSITQTDDLLGKLYSQLVNTGDSFSMVYFSDHGLAFKERGKEVQYLAHDDHFQQNFQVPFMVLSSDDKTHRVIKARRSANDFLSFFSQWTGISTEQIKNSYRFISEQKASPAYITNFKLQKVDYNHLGTDIFETRSRR
ncbi:Phosphoethanolamine transferase for glucans (OPG), alkaline phosphatase superfamily [Kosakonia oryzendophytica]|uniref:Phosphoethanolamine transferase for glucans (OPG), alkaline phosphatase superfamily n=1 Tax=Kosakonia oryzendophytica TaxID=1005665 RepID=A0A1C4B527_9ENTR|nr:phosphoethanolamine transferase [Kosakonia oryzendophytica]AMO48666.1 phosphoethanolamine transferase ybiP [Enterobacter sp. FY-07]WBT56813.1 phosphoethanolamine transferase [Kosakonia oryzendophytica]SCC01802.1 Phosphoethanolamine transferase for glucans (OPG), alkaline phosphatase superfamily [Kosakonia oryzendophytica]